MFMVKLIDSILNQTYKNIELLLIDDESPDQSGKIADDYALRDNRVISIHQKNQGCCGARNTGLERVTGEYLMFADGDDWMERDCVEYLVGLMEKYDCEMAMTDNIFTTRDQQQVKKDNIRIWSKEEATCGILYTDIPVGPWNKIYTTEVVKRNKLSFSVAWFGEGLYFSVMAAQYSNKTAVGSRKIYNYRLNNPNSGTTVREIRNGINALKNIKYIKDNLIVRTKRTIDAANWHIWLNNFGLIAYIISAKDINNNKMLFADAKKEMHELFPTVFRNSGLWNAKITFRKYPVILFATIFPVTIAKLFIWNKNRRFKKDNFE